MAAAVVEPDAPERVADGERGSRVPASREGSATFCSAVSAPSRLKDWKTKPMPLAPQAGERPLAEPAELRSSSRMLALRGAVEPGGELQQRRLAGARRAHDRGEGARSIDSVTPSSGAHLPVAAPEHADDVVEPDHGRSAFARGI